MRIADPQVDSPEPSIAETRARLIGGDWFLPGRFAILLGFLLIAAFPQIVFGSRALTYMDSGQFAYPVAFYHRESFWRGELPLWNPLNSCGIPFLAQWNTMTLYPLSLTYLLLPLPWSFGIFCLGHLFLGGMGMYFLAVFWTGNRLAAATAGAAFAFNGFTWYGLMWPHLIAALAWMPWLVLTTDIALRNGGRSVILAGVIGGVQMLCGGAEAIIQTWIVLCLLGLTEFFRRSTVPLRLIRRGMAIALIATGLAAAQILPFLDLLSHSQRNVQFADSNIAAMPLSGIVNYLVPLFGCQRNAQGLYVQATQGWTGSYYLGVSTVMLALFATWRRCGTRVWLLSAVSVFGLLMALGTKGFFYGWLKQLCPALGFMRFPVKFVILPTFAAPLLAAYGLNSLLSPQSESRAKEWKRAFALALGLTGLTATIVWVGTTQSHAQGTPPPLIGNAALRLLFLWAVIICIRGLQAADLHLKWRWFLSATVPALFWLDVLTHNSNLSPTAEARMVRPDILRERYNWNNLLDPGVSRAMLSPDAFWKMLSAGSDDSDTDIYQRRSSLFLDDNLLDHVAKLDGFYSMDVREFLEVFKRMYFTTNQAVKLKDFLGISLVNRPDNPGEWISRDSFRPLISGGQTPVFAGDPEILSVLLSDRFESQRTVYLPPEAKKVIRVAAGAKVKIISSHFGAQRVDAEVESDGDAIVVVAQTFYHWWRAYVDGSQVPVWRADYAFQAVQIPSGRHQLRLVYEDRTFFWGSIISAASFVISVGSYWLTKPIIPSGFSEVSVGK